MWKLLLKLSNPDSNQVTAVTPYIRSNAQTMRARAEPRAQYLAVQSNRRVASLPFADAGAHT